MVLLRKSYIIGIKGGEELFQLAAPSRGGNNSETPMRSIEEFS